MECLWNILFKKCGISNQPAAASAMIRVFPSLEHSSGRMSDTPETMGGLSGSTNCAPAIEHNRAKPMSELLSALISIADSSEFRFARFNIVYEGAQLVLPESPPIVSGVSDMRPLECSKLGKTRIIADAAAGWLEMPHFLNRMFHRHSTRNLYQVLFIILLIAKGGRTRKAATP